MSEQQQIKGWGPLYRLYRASDLLARGVVAVPDVAAVR